MSYAFRPRTTRNVRPELTAIKAEFRRTVKRKVSDDARSSPAEDWSPPEAFLNHPNTVFRSDQDKTMSPKSFGVSVACWKVNRLSNLPSLTSPASDGLQVEHQPRKEFLRAGPRRRQARAAQTNERPKGLQPDGSQQVQTGGLHHSHKQR